MYPDGSDMHVRVEKSICNWILGFTFLELRNKTNEQRINSKITTNVNINKAVVERVEQLTCLGSAVTADGGALQYVKARIKRANGIFVELHTLWKNKNTLMKTKILTFNIHVNSVLLYGCGTWEVDTQITHKLHMFVNRCL